MTKAKRSKPTIARRKAGLVINPPAPRPMEADHPALQIFHSNSGTPVISPNLPTPLIAANSAESTNYNQPSVLTTAVPQYRSTAVLESNTINLIDHAANSAIPTKNFYRKTNHIADQLDRSLTPAESKVLDHLVRLSIGFNKNTCQVRVSTLLNRTGYRSDKTVRAAINGLVAKGMIERLTHHNSPLGDEYIILQNSGTAVVEHSGTPVKSTAVLESKVTGHLNTILKDNLKTDDEEKPDAFALFSDELREAFRELSGEQPTKDEAARVQELAKLLVEELRDAASHTTHVSSPAAFLAAHLKRRLRQKAGSLEQPSVAMGKNASEKISAADVHEKPGKLSPDEIIEHTELLGDVFANGYTVEQATHQFAGGFHPEDWELILNGVNKKNREYLQPNQDSPSGNENDTNEVNPIEKQPDE